LGVRPTERAHAEFHGMLPPAKLIGVVHGLLGEGWEVEAEGRAFAVARGASARISTGVDWFGVTGEVTYDGGQAEMPEILRAMKRGQGWVRLGDGRLGLLPQDWLERWGWLGLGQTADDASGEEGSGEVRFPRQQAWLLDALLAERRDVKVDAGFRSLRKKLRAFGTARSLEEPAGLVGELRGYQREGLGWMDSLADLGLGGCLADDMGLGKTVQVLAFLERRRAAAQRAKAAARPTLVVVPRSVLFNWVDEAARFTPELTVAEHHGPARWRRFEKTRAADLIVTTYATLRLDVAKLREERFGMVILDEAQAIKNSQSQVSKAARLLVADQRLALTGTPVENRLEELWSLFEFLNPGMLGSAAGFAKLLEPDGGASGSNLSTISEAIRPFFLRRTKAQVLAELPEKTEQTIYVELPPKQRKAYNELADYYRKLLLGADVEAEEQGGSKLEVLTALLRLRQCACHEGLIDEARADAPSAKLDELVERLEEIAQEGNKALIFSQFTSFLALLRARLDAAEIPYEYLDGKTKDRRAGVERFQSDPSVPAFLISLKAGGTGLNLTAADYVFLLDPWWNPAVESQAIDRAHRIGRTRPVVAYRIVARKTIEERVLELQATKRELVSTLFDERSGSIANLSRDELERLLS
jgi:SNF2 family DNA or RNA helicase